MDTLQQLATWIVFRLRDGVYEYLLPRAQRWKEIQGGWAESSRESSSYVAWGLGIVVVFGLLFAIVQSRREKKKRHERELLYFDRKAVDKDLDRRHIDLLTRMVKQVSIQQPYRALESYDVLQHLIETYHDQQKFSEQEHKLFHQQLDEIKKVLGYNKIEETVQLQSSKEIRKGQRVSLTLTRGGQQYQYASSLLFNTDERMTFDAGSIDLDTIKPAGTTVDVQFYRENDAGYRFTATLSEAPDKEKKELYLRHPGKLIRDQARSFSRMEVHFAFSYYHIPRNQFNSIEIDTNLERCANRPVFMGESIDISGGGLAFFTRHYIKKGDFLYLNFQQLSEEHSEPVLSEVVYQGTDNERKCYIIRAKSFNINESAQDTIMRFIYQMQRKAARRLKFAPRR